jgi:SAM-dependent methyltransferase
MPEIGVVEDVDLARLRTAVRNEYAVVANQPGKGFHFHTGRPLAKLLGYSDEWLEGIPESAVESLAGTGNPFSLGEIRPGERVVDIGCGAGMDSFLAAKFTGESGSVVGVDMTPDMLGKARAAAEAANIGNIEFKEALAEELPVPDGWADVVISNGVVNLCPDKPRVFGELLRILKPGGRLQIADILVDKPVPEEAKTEIDLWTG